MVKLDNAIQNVFVGNYRRLYDTALELLKQFNSGTGSSYGAAPVEEFQARVMRGEQTQEIPSIEERDRIAEFLLPKILKEATDVLIMRKLMEWISTLGG